VTTFTIQPIAELFRQGDRSARFSIQTEAPKPYFAAAAVADPQDLEGATDELRRQFVAPRLVMPPGRSLTYLRDCYVLPNAAIVTADGNIVRESCFPYTGIWVPKFFAPWITEDEGSLQVDLAEPERIEAPAVYVREHGETGFFHWMHSVLPRVDVLTRHQVAEDFALLYDTGAPNQRDGLALCGLADVPLIRPNRDRPQFFSELLFPSALVEEGDFWLRPPSVAAFYNALPAPTMDGPGRVYITRQDASVRRLRNEAEVLALLKSRGFVSLELGAFSFPQQLALLRSCEFVVGVHGAGLSHIVSMPLGGRVLEILHPRRFWSTYRAMAARRGLGYGFVLGNDEDTAGDTFDFVVDIEKVGRVLSVMGIT
jgi:hypothetical protein